jgi:hypothetical protein
MNEYSLKMNLNSLYIEEGLYMGKSTENTGDKRIYIEKQGGGITCLKL